MQTTHRLIQLAMAITLSASAAAAEPPKAAPQNPAAERPVGLSATTFGAILPENSTWRAFPAFPPEARLSVLVGDPGKPGPYVVRVKLPGGVKLMPHTHPEDRIYTVIAGVFYIGLGTSFDAAALKAYPPGAVLVLPANTPHFHWAKSGDYMTQVAGTGPLGLTYITPGDDPRSH